MDFGFTWWNRDKRKRNFLKRSLACSARQEKFRFIRANDNFRWKKKRCERWKRRRRSANGVLFVIFMLGCDPKTKEKTNEREKCCACLSAGTLRSHSTARVCIANVKWHLSIARDTSDAIVFRATRHWTEFVCRSMCSQEKKKQYWIGFCSSKYACWFFVSTLIDDRARKGDKIRGEIQKLVDKNHLFTHEWRRRSTFATKWVEWTKKNFRFLKSMNCY